MGVATELTLVCLVDEVLSNPSEVGDFWFDGEDVCVCVLTAHQQSRWNGNVLCC